MRTSYILGVLRANRKLRRMGMVELQ
jgi:hypothetical protein